MDLRSGVAFWPTKSGLLTSYPALEHDETADVLVIGAGITGALLTDRLTRAGLDVVTLDRRDVARGSTSASTALLQYEIDTHLTDLRELVGRAHADRAYLLCLEAIDSLEELAREVGEGEHFRRKHSLYYASSRRDLGPLREEYQARRTLGLSLDFLGPTELREQFGLRQSGALLSRDAAEVDPYRLAHALLGRAQAAGARIYDRTAVDHWQEGGGGFSVRTSRGAAVQAQWLVVAGGYESLNMLPQGLFARPLAQLKNSYALVTEPLELPDYLRRTLVWETARPYLYLRTTADNRLMVGGEDDEHASVARRENMLPRKTRILEQKVHKLFPELKLEVAYSWAGTFGETRDGLAYIGPHPRLSDKMLFALGYGGNGITYSQVAADLLTARIGGHPSPDEPIFSFER